MTCLISAIQSQDVTMRDTKSGFPNPNYPFFKSCFQHMIRIAFVYSFKAGQVFLFFFPHFSAKTCSGYFLTRPYTPAIEKKNLTPFESFGCTLRELHTKLQLEMRKMRWEKASQYSIILSAGPARRVTSGVRVLLVWFARRKVKKQGKHSSRCVRVFLLRSAICFVENNGTKGTRTYVDL